MRIPANDTIPMKIRKSILVNQDLKRMQADHGSKSREEDVFRLDTKINKLIFSHIAETRKRIAHLSLDSQRQLCDSGFKNIFDSKIVLYTAIVLIHLRCHTIQRDYLNNLSNIGKYEKITFTQLVQFYHHLEDLVSILY